MLKKTLASRTLLHLGQLLHLGLQQRLRQMIDKFITVLFI